MRSKINNVVTGNSISLWRSQSFNWKSNTLSSSYY